jgi:DNA polymerase-3 subunit alpha
MSEFVKNARQMGFRSIGVTDHGTVGGLIKFWQECRKKYDVDQVGSDPIIPLMGCEFYLSRDRFARSKELQPDGRRGNRHIVLLAKNWEGYQNLCAMSESSWVDGFYNDPRIDMKLLEDHHSGLICSSACLSSVVNSNLLHGRYNEAKKSVGLFKELFGDDFYLEVMFHGIDAERYIIPDIIRLSEDTNTKIIASNDVHYLKKEDGKSQEMLMCMSTSKCIHDEKRIHFPYHEFYLKEAHEMLDVFRDIPHALTNTNEIVDKIDIASFERNFGGIMRLPKFEIPNEFSNSYDYLCSVARDGLTSLGLGDSRDHIERLRTELDDVKVALDNNNYDFSTYFLIVQDYINWAKNEGIRVGPGRGSGFGSILLRCLGISYGPDVISSGLLWERFLGFSSERFVKESDFFEIK